MEIKLERGMEKGKFFFRVYLDKSSEALSTIEAHKAITNTDPANEGMSIFCNERKAKLSYGDQPINVTFTGDIDIRTTPIEDIAAELKKRTKIIEQAKGSYDFKEETTINV